MTTIGSLGRGSRIGSYVVDRALRSDPHSIVYACTSAKPGSAVLVELCPAGLVTRDDGGQLTPRDALASDRLEALKTHFDHVTAKLAGIHAPGLVLTLDVVTANNTRYLVQPFDESVTLQDVLVHAQHLDYDDAKRILFPLLESLRLLHEKDILHLGIAPDTILIRHDGSPALDGNRFLLSGPGPRPDSVSPNFSAPEQVDGRGTIGPSSDIYSFAAVMYRCITGELPPTVAERRAAIAGTGADILKRSREIAPPGFSNQLHDAIDHALALEPGDRPRTVREWTREFLELSPKGDLTMIRDRLDLDAEGSRGKDIAAHEAAVEATANRHKLFRALISGKGQSYYMGPIVRQDDRGLLPGIGWNTAAFLFHVFWLFYRRMFLFGGILAPLTAALVFWAVYAVVGNYPLSGRYWLINPTIDQSFLISVFLFSAFFGLFGNYLYYLHLRFKIGAVSRRYPSVAAQREICSRIGGVSEIAPFVPVLALACLGYYGLDRLKARDQKAREQVGEAIRTLNVASMLVSEYYLETGTWPETAADVIKARVSYQYVGDVSILKQLIVATFKTEGALREFAGRSVAYFGEVRDGKITWYCGSIDLPLEYLPQECQRQLK